MASKNKHDMKNVTFRIKQTRQEIELLKNELETMIAVDPVKPASNSGLSATPAIEEPGNTQSPLNTAFLAPSVPQGLKVGNATSPLNTAFLAPSVPQGLKAKPSPTKTQHTYNREEAVSYMKKQKAKRLEEQKAQSHVHRQQQISREMKTKRLKQLQERTRELVKRNVQIKRSKSQESRLQVPRERGISHSVSPVHREQNGGTHHDWKNPPSVACQTQPPIITVSKPIMTDVIRKDTKETQTTANPPPSWPPNNDVASYPYNFINTVRRKLKYAVNSPVAIHQREVGVQYSTKTDFRDNLSLGPVANLELVPPENDKSDSNTSKNIPEIAVSGDLSEMTDYTMEFVENCSELSVVLPNERRKRSSSDTVTSVIDSDEVGRRGHSLITDHYSTVTMDSQSVTLKTFDKVLPLTEPAVSLFDKKKIELSPGKIENLKPIANSNEIQLKFAAEVRLLNDFNESLRQFKTVEKEFENLKNQNNDTTSQRTNQNNALNNRLTSSMKSTNHNSSINFSRGDLIISSDDLNLSQLNLTNTTTITATSLVTTNEDSLNPAVNLFDQMIKDEDARIQHLKAMIKIRQQALLDRTKSELVWLEIQKKRLIETGELEQASLLKKKQRGILLKHEQERNEMKKLQQMRKYESEQRKLKLTQQKQQLIKTQLSTDEMLTSKMKITHRRRSSASSCGPLRVVQNETTTTISQKSSDGEVSVKSILQQQVTPNNTNLVLNAKRSLSMRETALQQRRQTVEELLKWHRKLVEEERKITDLETAAQSVIGQYLPKQLNDVVDKKKKHQFTGKQLNQLWRNISGCLINEERKFDEMKIYEMSQVTLERFCKSASTVGSSDKNNCVITTTTTGTSDKENVGDYSLVFDADDVQSVDEISTISELIENFSKIEDEISLLSRRKSNIIQSSELDISSQNSSESSKTLTKDQSVRNPELSIKESISVEVKDECENEEIVGKKFEKINSEDRILSNEKIPSCVSEKESGNVLSEEISLQNKNEETSLDSKTISEEISTKTEDQLPISKDSSIKSSKSVEKSAISKKIAVENKISSFEDKSNTVASEISTNTAISEDEERFSVEISIKPKNEDQTSAEISTKTEDEIETSKTASKSQRNRTISAGISTKIEDEVETSKTTSKSQPNRTISAEISTKTEDEVETSKTTSKGQPNRTISAGISTKIEDEAETSKTTSKSQPNRTISAEISTKTEDEVETSKTTSKSQPNRTISAEISTKIDDEEETSKTRSKSQRNKTISAEISTKTEDEVETSKTASKSQRSRTISAGISTKIEDEAETSKETSKIQRSRAISAEIYTKIEDEVETSIKTSKSQSNRTISAEISAKTEDEVEISIKTSKSEQLKSKLDEEISTFEKDSSKVLDVESEISEEGIQSEIKETNNQSVIVLDDTITKEEISEIIEEKSSIIDLTTPKSIIENDSSQLDLDEALEAATKIEETLSRLNQKFEDVSITSSSTSSSTSKQVESLSKDSTSKKKIDVKKRVSEILDDVIGLNRVGDKSPRMQDLYVTTYDVPSPTTSPELPGETTVLLDDTNAVTSSSLYGNEAEELFKKQLAIEQEIKQLEQMAQKEQLPYVYVREIPNKPPPPYTPPSCQSVAERATGLQESVFPTDQREINAITNYCSKVMYKALQTSNLDKVKFSMNAFKLCSKVDVGKDRVEFLFNVCKDIARDYYLKECSSSVEEEPSWLMVGKKKMSDMRLGGSVVKKSMDGDEFEKFLNRKVKELLGVVEVNVTESAIVKWGRKKRDHVDEVLVVESQEEESQWISFHKEELIVKDRLTNDIMKMLLGETAEVFKKIIAKRNCSS